MADDTQKAAPAPEAEELVVEKPVAEKVPPPAPEPENPADEKPAVQEAPDKPKPEEPEKTKVEEATDAEKVAQSASFTEETNVAGELPPAQKKALEEFKKLVQEALNKHEFTAPPAAAKEEEKAPEPAAEDKKEQAKEAAEEKKEEDKTEASAPTTEETSKEEEIVGKVVEATEKVETEAPLAAEPKEEEKAAPSSEEVKEVAEKPPAVDDDGAKTVEAIEETVVPVASAAPVETEPAKETEAAAPAEEAPAPPPPAPEEVSIWGIPLLTDEKSDVVLLKFLRARDFKVKEAFTMLKNTVRWRKEFGIESLLEEDLGNVWDKVVFMAGSDKEGHPVCYNVFGAFQEKELYQDTFSDEEKRSKFLRWRIQFLEKSIRKLDFSPTGINTIVQVNDLKNSFWPGKKEVRQTTNQALQLLQDNYPEFVARQVFINVPWWYLAFNRMISPFLTQRTKSKFVFAGPSKTAETLFKYITPELVPVQYGGLTRDGELEFTPADPLTEITIKPGTKHTIEIPVTEKCVLVWEKRVVGWDVNYAAEFVPGAEGGYTVIVSKTRKVTGADEPVISDSFKAGEPGKVVLTIDNPSSKKKKLMYRSKTKPHSD